MGWMHTDSSRHIVVVATQKVNVNQTINLQLFGRIKQWFAMGSSLRSVSQMIVGLDGSSRIA